MMPRQFRLRSLFILTAVVALGCLVGPPIVREVRELQERFQAARSPILGYGEKPREVKKVESRYKPLSEPPARVSVVAQADGRSYGWSHRSYLDL
jgi:hypothetical protein